MKKNKIYMFGIVMWLAASGAGVAESNLQIHAPVYGNWCGPHHPVDMGHASPPIDALDAACQRHDYCIAAKGQYSCGCDIPFLREVRSIQFSSLKSQQDARAIYDAIALVPCDTADGTSLKRTMFAIDLIYDVVSGNGTGLEVFTRWKNLVFGS